MSPQTCTPTSPELRRPGQSPHARRAHRRRLPHTVGTLLAALPLVALLPVAAPAGADVAGVKAPVAPAAEREVVDLGTLGGTASFARGINDRGVVVGSSEVATDSTTSHAFRWRRGRMTDLGTLGGGPLDSSVAMDVNDRGQIVGFSTAAAGSGDFNLHAVLWDGGRIVDLGTLGGLESVATGINDDGDVVGRSTTADGETHAFLWRDGQMIDLGTPGTGFSAADAINDRGQVLAAVGLPTPHVWEDGAWSPLELGPDAEWASATDINEQGHVAGLTVVGGLAVNRAVVWRGGPPVDLGFPPDEGSQAAAINDHGQVAGTSFETGAFLWEGGEVTHLPALAARAEAVAINDDGVVAGYSPTQEGISPHYHAVIWR